MRVPTDGSTLLTKREASERLRISLSALNTLLREQRIPHVTIGRRSVRILASDIDAYIVSNSTKGQ